MLPTSKHRYIRISAMILGMVSAVSATPPESNLERYRDTDNSVTRMQILREVGRQEDAAAKAGGSAVAEASLTAEDKTLLLEALEDPRPTVVESSVRRIGELKAAEFEQQLITLFSAAKKRFRGGYAERLKGTIISAVGQCNGPQAMPFIGNLLTDGSGDQYFETILSAARETGNPALLSDVQEFRNRREMELRQEIAAGADPLSASRLRVLIRLARDVESGLSDGNGGRQ